MRDELHIYIASGWFNAEQVKHLKAIENVVSLVPDAQVYSPRKHAGVYKPSKGNHKAIVTDNLAHLHEADLVVASTEGKDLGTLFECGYAHAINVPIIYYFPLAMDFNIMLAVTGKVVKTPEELKTALDEFNFARDSFIVNNYTGGML